MHQDETPLCLPSTQVRGLQVHPRFCPSHSCPISNWSSSLGEFTFLILPESFHPFCFLHCNSFTSDSPHLLCANTIARYDCLLSVPSPPVHCRLSVQVIFQQRGFHSPRNNPGFLPSLMPSGLTENYFIPMEELTTFCFILQLQ